MVKKHVLKLCLVFLTMLMVGCGDSKLVSDLKISNDSELKGISFKTEMTSYDRNEESIKVILSNDSEEEYMYGDSYSLEHLKGGKWVKVPFKKDVLFYDTGYKLSAHSSVDFEYDIKDKFGSLKPGTYRVIKQISKWVEKSKYNIAAEFTIK